ncbi:MAG: hypothetical protein O9248_00935 [Rhodobacteraceae bacterium]|jgi:hypothetical protein|nr:hypothetical protein [Paracoccaceae bacterium]
MTTSRKFSLSVAAALLAACAQQSDVQLHLGCSSTACVSLDELELNAIPNALGKLDGFVCLSVREFTEPGPKVCLRDAAQEVKMVWFGTAPDSISASHNELGAKYIELLYTRNEFDRIEGPMLRRFGTPTTTSFIPYRNNTAPSRMHTWESEHHKLTLFDNSASTSIQITYK